MRLWKRSEEPAEPKPVCCASCGAALWEDGQRIPSSLLLSVSVATDGPRTRTTITNGNTGEIIHECPPKRVGISMTGGTLRAAGMTIRNQDVAIEAVDCDVDVEGLGLE